MWNLTSEDLLLNDDCIQDDDGRFGWDESGKVFGINCDEVKESKSRNTRSIHCLRFRINNSGMKSSNSLLYSKNLPSPIGLMLRIDCEITHPTQLSLYCYADQAEGEPVIVQHSRFDVSLNNTDDDLDPSFSSIVIKCINMKFGHILEAKLSSSLDSQLTVVGTSIMDIEVPLEISESYGSKPKFLEVKQFNSDVWLDMQVQSFIRYIHSLARMIKDVNGVEVAAHFIESCQFKSCEDCQNNSTIHLIDEYIEEKTIPPVVFCSSANCGGGLVGGDYFRATMAEANFKAAIQLRFKQYISPYFDWERWRERDAKFSRLQRRREYYEDVKRYVEFYHDKLICPVCKQYEPYDSYNYRSMVNNGITDPAKKYRPKCAKCNVSYRQSIAWNAETWHMKNTLFVQTKQSKVEKLRQIVAIAQAKRDSYVPPPMFKDTLGDKLEDLEGLLYQELTERGVDRILDPAKYYKKLRHKMKKKKMKKMKQQELIYHQTAADAPLDMQPQPADPLPPVQPPTQPPALQRIEPYPNPQPAFFMTDSFSSTNLAENDLDDDAAETVVTENEEAVRVSVDAPTPLPPNDVLSKHASSLDHIDSSRTNGSTSQLPLDNQLLHFHSHLSGPQQSSVYSIHSVERKHSTLLWATGIPGLNPVPVTESSPFHNIIALPRKILLRVPCLHSSRHEVLKPWEPADLIVLKLKQRLEEGQCANTTKSPSPIADGNPSSAIIGPHHSLYPLPEKIAHFVGIRYFYTTYDERKHEPKPPIALPSIIADTHTILHYSKCEFPSVADADLEDLVVRWVAPEPWGSHDVVIPVGAIFSAALVPAMDIDLSTIHYVHMNGSTTNLPVNEDFVYELVFPVQAVDRTTDEVIFGYFRVCIDRPLSFFDEFDDINDIIVVHSKHHKVFIEQLMQRMKRMRNDFLLTSELSAVIGPISSQRAAIFVVRDAIVEYDVNDVDFLCEGH